MTRKDAQLLFDWFVRRYGDPTKENPAPKQRLSDLEPGPRKSKLRFARRLLASPLFHALRTQLGLRLRSEKGQERNRSRGRALRARSRLGLM